MPDSADPQAHPSETPLPGEKGNGRFDSNSAREAARKRWEKREDAAPQAAAGAVQDAGASPQGDDEFRSVLRSIAADGSAPAAARVAAARAGLDMGDEDVAGLPPSLFHSLPERQLRLIIEHQPADLAAVVQLLVDHELATCLPPEPEPASVLT